MNKNKEIKNWDSLTISILLISLFAIIFSFFSPSIFTLAASKKSLNFTETAQIGDTLNGLMGPFIALAGVLLTFLAFYMQIKANQIQINIFKEGIIKSKERDIANEKIDCYNKLNLLNVDLESIIIDIELKASNLKEYYENEKAFPFETHLLFRTPSKKYTRILEIDRLSVYKGYNLFLSQRKNWLKDFSNMYSLLDFLPEFLDDLYIKYDSHSKDIFEKKIAVRNGLLNLLRELSRIINFYLEENSRQNYLSFPASQLANESIRIYYNIINESFDENNNPVRETDFNKISNEFLKSLITEVLKLREDENTYDRRLEPSIEIASDLRKQIYDIKTRALEFAGNIEVQYNNLIISNNNGKSYLTIIKELQTFLDKELKNVKIEY